MQREIKKYLFDIKESINSIEDFLGTTLSLHDYLENKLLRRAIEREIEIIGEAVNNILKIDPHINISDSRRIVDLRNWIIHGYNSVDNKIIWGVISKDIPKLKKQVEILISK